MRQTVPHYEHITAITRCSTLAGGFEEKSSPAVSLNSCMDEVYGPSNIAGIYQKECVCLLVDRVSDQDQSNDRNRFQKTNCTFVRRQKPSVHVCNKAELLPKTLALKDV